MRHRTLVSGCNRNYNSGGYGVFQSVCLRVLRGRSVIETAKAQIQYVHPIGHGVVYGRNDSSRGGRIIDPGCSENFVTAEERSGSHPGNSCKRGRHQLSRRRACHEGSVPDFVDGRLHRLRIRKQTQVIPGDNDLVVRESSFPLRVAGRLRQGGVLEHWVRNIDATVNDPDLDSAAGQRASSCFVPQALRIEEDRRSIQQQPQRTGKVNLLHTRQGTHADVVLGRHTGYHRIHHRIHRSLNLNSGQAR